MERLRKIEFSLRETKVKPKKLTENQKLMNKIEALEAKIDDLEERVFGEKEDEDRFRWFPLFSFLPGLDDSGVSLSEKVEKMAEQMKLRFYVREGSREVVTYKTSESFLEKIMFWK